MTIIVVGLLLLGLFLYRAQKRTKEEAEYRRKRQEQAAEVAEYRRYDREQQKEQLVADFHSKRRAFGEKRVASLRKMTSDLRWIDAKLEESKKEFAARAFGPFWDKVAEAAGGIAIWSSKITMLSQEHKLGTYGQGWVFEKGLVVVMTTTNWTPAEIPDPSAVLAKMAAVVRMGQSDFEFASIYEQRRTQQVLIEGFKTLQEAVDRTRTSVVSALGELQKTTQAELRAIQNKIDASTQDQLSAQAASSEAIVSHLRSLSTAVNSLRY